MQLEISIESLLNKERIESEGNRLYVIYREGAMKNGHWTVSILTKVLTKVLTKRSDQARIT